MATDPRRTPLSADLLADVLVERFDPSAFRFPGIVRRPRLAVVRAEDLVVAAFEFRNLRLEVDENSESPAAVLRPADGTGQAFLVVHFQPQNIAEQAFFETTPANDLKLTGKLDDDGTEVRVDRDHPSAMPPPTDTGPPFAGALPVRTLIAGPSRLVFRVPAGATIPYTTAGLLDAIRRFELNVPATALPPEPPPIFVRPQWIDELTEVLLARTGPKRGPLARLRARSRLVRWEDATDLLPVTMHAGAARLLDLADGIEVATVEAIARETTFRRVVDEIDRDRIAELIGWRRRRPRLGAPRETETALELPFRLILAPNRYGAWAHSPEPVSSPSTGRTELWHTRLATREETEDGLVIEEGDHRLRTVRAVWARSGSHPPDPDQAFDTNPNNTPGHSNEPFRMSLDPADRFDIVHLSSNFNVQASRTRRYRPVPIHVDRLMLASLGAWIDSRGQWEPPPGLFEVEEWRHRGTMARDHYVRVVYKGYLWPFGHRASVVKVTERKLHPPSLPHLSGSPAILRQRMYLVVRQPVLTYGDPNLRNAAGHRFDHQLPFTQVRITTVATPNLDDPQTTDYPATFSPTSSAVFNQTGELQSLFWPHVGNAPFPFHLVAEDLEGRKVEFTAPLLFVSNVFAWKKATLERIKTHYESTVAASLGTVRLNGQRMALAPESEPGDTMFEADALELGAEILTAAQLARLGPDRPQFYPRVRRARIVVPVVKGFTGNEAPTVVEFAEEFLTNGFPDAASGHPNAGEVFLKVAASPISLDFSGGGDKAGAFVQPNLNLAGLSRTLGPVGGSAANLATLAAGNFTPEQFFDALKAKVFGVVDLGELIEAASVEAADLVPKFVTEAISALESFTAELARLEARLAALKAEADAAAAVPASVKADITARQAAITARLGEVAAAIDQLLDGTDATADLTTAVNGLITEVNAVSGLIQTVGPNVASDVRQSLASTVDGLLADIGAGVATVAAFVDRLKQALQLVEELTLRFDWKPQVKDWPVAGDGAIFRARNTKSNADAIFTIAAEIQAKSKLRSEPRIDVACRLHNFTLNLIGEQSFILLHFNKLEFSAKSGTRPDVNVEFDDIEFTGVLSFVETLRTLIPLDGFSDPPALDVSEKGISASYSMALPDAAIGVFSLQNVSLGAGFNVPFLLDPLTVRFNFCERESPFLLTVSMFGGGGFFAITLDPDGVEILEAAFEFGASLSVNLGVASGGVTVMAGIYYRMEVDEATLTGYFRMAGEVDVLGLISACIELYLGLAYEFASGKCAGKATITVEVSIAFFSTSVSISAERKFAGSNGDPTFAELMGPGPEFPIDPWTKYCEAFA